MDIATEISRIRDNISKEIIQKRAEYEEKAKNAILANMNSLTLDSFDSIMSLMNTDFYDGETHINRFYPLFSTPQRNMIRTNKIEELKAFIVTAFEKEDLARIDEARSHLYGIKYGAASLLLYIKDRDRYNVFIPSTVEGLRVAYPEKAQDILYEEPFDKNYSLFNSLCNDLKKKYSIKPQELDIILTVLGKRREPLGPEPTEVSYFILRTGGGEYSDQPEQKYNFKEGIPGSNQLRSAENNGRFVYLEKGAFYGKGQIGKIRAYDQEGTTYYDAEVIDYEKIEPVQFDDISSKLSFKSIGQADILKISEADFKIITESHRILAKSIHTIDDIVKYIESKGFFFPTQTIINYHTCLLTKPFVILSGITGTGKTKLAELYANGFYGIDKDNPYYKKIAVQSNWSDNRPLLGYYNPFIGAYHTTPFLQFLLKAIEDCDSCNLNENGRCQDTTKCSSKYFVCLDEMNLAHVEYYFADFLSAIEMEDKTIHLHSAETKTEEGKLIPSKVRIPDNFYVVGTVNIDETTKEFSPKVLDRANTIDLDVIDLEKWKEIQVGLGVRINEEAFKVISDIHSILRKYSLHFGYRVCSEILKYIDNSKLGLYESLDLEIKQKILPKLSGDDNPRLRKSLEELKEYLTGRQCEQSETKLANMLEKLKLYGFTSFYD